MSYKRTIVFLILFISLATFYYVYEIKGGESRRQAEEQEKLLFSFEVEEVTGLILENAGESIMLRREGPDWKIVAPLDTAAEQSSVDKVVNALATLKYEREIGPQADLEPFGLVEAGAALEITSGDEILGKLLVGKDTPDGSKLYVKLSDEASVFTVANSARRELVKNLFDLRDKNVIDFHTPDVEALTVMRNGKQFSFEKPGEEGWNMTSPRKYRADAGKIRRLLDVIRFARVEKFVEEQAADLEEYGLTLPSAIVELQLAEGTAALYLGDRTGPDDSDNVFARRGDTRRVLELPPSILDTISGEVNDWRDRTLLDFEKERVARLQIISPVGSTAMERSQEDSSQWSVTAPEPAQADAEEIESLLSYLYSVKATRFLQGDEAKAAGQALENAAAQLKLWLDENDSPLVLSVAEKEGDSEVYVKTDPVGEFSVAHAGLMEEMIADIERFKDKSVLKFKAADVERIEIERESRSFSIKRNEDVGWKLPNDLDIEEYDVDRFLWDLQELDYVRAVPRDGDDAFYGFDSPTLTIGLGEAGAGKQLELVIGKMVSDTNLCYARGADAESVMEMQENFVKEWLERF